MFRVPASCGRSPDPPTPTHEFVRHALLGEVGRKASVSTNHCPLTTKVGRSGDYPTTADHPTTARSGDYPTTASSHH